MSINFHTSLQKLIKSFSITKHIIMRYRIHKQGTEATYGGAMLELSLSYSSPFKKAVELCTGVSSLPLLELKDDLLVLTLCAVDGCRSIVISLQPKTQPSLHRTKFQPLNHAPIIQPCIRLCKHPFTT